MIDADGGLCYCVRWKQQKPINILLHKGSYKMSKVKTDELPGRAKDLYIKMYCERKGGVTEENLHDAAQSWLSLGSLKKQHFIDTITTKYAVDKAQRIIKTEPFLKEKNPPKEGATSKVCENVEQQVLKDIASGEDDAMDNVSSGHSDVPSVHDDVMECDFSDNPHSEANIVEELQPDVENIPQPDDLGDCEMQQTQASSKVQNIQRSLKNVVDEDTDSSNDENAEKEENVPLPEPVLPPIKTGKDLFELIKAKNGQSHRMYEMLTAREKVFYGHAVIAIKRDYVKKYREFLDSLSKKQLFDYYMKILG